MNFITFDSAYLEKLATGDAAVEEHFHRYFGELIFIKLRSRQFAPDAMDDIRQETFLRVLQAMRKDGIREPERIGAFVNAVCNNVILEYHRSDARAVLLDEPPDMPDQAADSEQHLIDRERRAHVRDLLARMPARNQRLLTAIFLEERPAEEVCREFRVDRNYLRVLLFRARTQLREAMQKDRRRGASTAAK